MENIVVNGVEYTPIKQAKPRIIRVCFELTMPSAASWNGKWSGARDKHYIFKEFPPSRFEKNKENIIGSWDYRWSDGWCACVESTVIDADESRRRKRINKGFCGYGWMVDSILSIGKILDPDDLREYLDKNKQEPPSL